MSETLFVFSTGECIAWEYLKCQISSVGFVIHSMWAELFFIGLRSLGGDKMGLLCLANIFHLDSIDGSCVQPIS